MPLTTAPRASYVWRCLAIAIICVVLGLWGVYDYVYTIPARQRAYEKFVVVESIRDALEATLSSTDVEERYEAAREKVQGELVTIIREASEALGQADHLDTPASQRSYIDLLFLLSLSTDQPLPERVRALPQFEDARRVDESVAAGKADRNTWFRQLLLVNAALQQGPRAANQPLAGPALASYDWAQSVTNQVGEVTPPSAFDRPVQWLFILCLPLAPYYLVRFFQVRGQRYRLDDDGTLHLPDGAAWKPEEIADIDMSRWMAKSVAEVVHTDGARVKLDDYFHRDLHLIIGRLAHQFDPEKWNEDGTMVKGAGADEPPGEPGDEPLEDPDRA